MTNKKSTKKALLSSVLSLVLCLSMLIGTTFAWFTDSVTSANNIIKSGNLDVELEYSTDNESWQKVTSTTNIFKDGALWEPGYTEVVYLRVSNLGSLALKYQLGVNIISETEGVNKDGKTFKLSDYIEFGVVDPVSAKFADRDAARAAVTDAKKISAGYTKANSILAKADPNVIALVVYMPETVGNEANHNGTQPSINLGLNLYATQFTAEEDSFDELYDKGAYLPVVYNAEEFASALEQGASVKLGDNITLANEEHIVIPAGSNVVIDMNGKTVVGGKYNATTNREGYVILNEGNLTIKGDENSVMSANGLSNGFGIILNAGNLVLDGGTYTGSVWGGTAGDTPGYTVRNEGTMVVEPGTTIHGTFGSVSNPGGNLTINGGTFTNDDLPGVTNYLVSVWNNGTITINDGDFTFTSSDANAMGSPIVGAWDGGTIAINGGTFDAEQGAMGYGTAPITITGGTFKNAAKNVFGNNAGIAVFVPEGYEAEKTEEGYMVVSAAIDGEDELDEAIANASNGDRIVIDNGDFQMPDSAKGKTLTIVGSGDTNIINVDDGSYEHCEYSLEGATITFENLTIKTDGHTYAGYARMNATYNNCVIENTYTLYGNSVFNNCTFNVSGDSYNIWTWGAPTAEFNNCTFNTSGKAILLYGDTNTTLKVKNCVFNDDNKYADVNNKAAIEVGTDWSADTKTIIVNNTVVNGFDITTKGISTGTTLWGNKNSIPNTRLNVVVDGVDVY